MSETEQMAADLAGTREAADALSGVLADLELRAQGFGRALTEALTQATAGGRGLDTVLRGLALRLSGLALDAGLKPLQGFLSEGIAGLLGGGGPGGRVTPFAKGGVIRTPAYFPLDGGTGLAGEAGAEAILPLRRGADGTLGVATGGGGEAARPIVFNVTASDADSFLRSEAQIATMLSRSVARGGRNL